MFDESTPSPLPVDVKPRHVLTGSTSTEFDLASLADARPPQVKVTRAFLLGAVLVSLAALRLTDSGALVWSDEALALWTP